MYTKLYEAINTSTVLFVILVFVLPAQIERLVHTISMYLQLHEWTAHAELHMTKWAEYDLSPELLDMSIKKLCYEVEKHLWSMAGSILVFIVAFGVWFACHKHLPTPKSRMIFTFMHTLSSILLCGLMYFISEPNPNDKARVILLGVFILASLIWWRIRRRYRLATIMFYTLGLGWVVVAFWDLFILKYYNQVVSLFVRPPVLLSDYMKDDPEFLQRLSDLLIPVEMTFNDVFLDQKRYLNAAAGLGANFKHIYVSSNLFETFSQDIILAVIAHEVGHVKNNDLYRLTRMRFFTHFGGLLLSACLYCMLKCRIGVRYSFIASMSLFAICFHMQIYFVGYTSHLIEFEADRYAVNIHKDNGFYLQAFFMHATRLMGQFMYDYGDTLFKYTFDHPSIIARMDAINMLTGTTLKEFLARLAEADNSVRNKKAQCY